MANKPVVVSCPQCGKDVVWNSDSRYRPFCSERCKLIDLGRWSAENYRIPQEEGSTEEDTPHQA